MIFNTWTYGVFLVLAVALYWASPRRARHAVLIALGFFFYAYYYPPHVALIAATLPAAAWVTARIAASEGAARRRWLALGVAACLGTLVFYKYQGFLASTMRSAFALVNVNVPLWVRPLPVRAPLGISFFVFEYVHYLIEVYRGTFAPARFRDLTLFIMFFPTLICGPIKRFPGFHPDEAVAAFDPAGASEGIRRILVGLAKKTLVADTIAPWCGPVFNRPDQYDTLGLWLGVYGYALQIYFDFAGYSDIAIGTARLFGYRVPENFDYPYLQPNIARFWRAWHMSLTSWITDYVYIPLGGSRRGERRAAWNRLMSMTLCGLWHGAAMHFALWGFYHGVMLNLYRLWERVRGPRAAPPNPLARAFGTLLTFHVVCIGWVLFVCDTRRALVVLPRLLGLG